MKSSIKFVAILAFVLGSCTPLSVRERPISYQVEGPELITAIEEVGTTLRPSGLVGQDYTTYQVLRKMDSFIALEATETDTRFIVRSSKEVTVTSNSIKLLFTLSPFGDMTKVSASGKGVGVAGNIATVYRYLDEHFRRIEDE